MKSFKTRFLSLFVIVFISACGGNASEPAPAVVTSTTVPTAIPEAAQPTATPAYQAVSPIPSDEASPPVLIEIPAIGLLEAVAPMTWGIAQVDGQRTTVWQVPDDAAGWHIDSAGVAAAGNLILSGHQEQGDAVFKAISLGSVETGHEIFLTNENGERFAYRVTAVSEPIPLEGTTAEQLDQVEEYYEQDEAPKLTLITGWPDFTTTHRLFVVAELLGQAMDGS